MPISTRSTRAGPGSSAEAVDAHRCRARVGRGWNPLLAQVLPRRLQPRLRAQPAGGRRWRRHDNRWGRRKQGERERLVGGRGVAGQRRRRGRGGARTHSRLRTCLEVRPRGSAGRGGPARREML
ncbi:unnamed protein product [Musa banksii]